MYPEDAKYKLQIRLDVQIHTNKATKKVIERATYPGDAEFMLQFSLVLPQLKLNQVPFSSSIAVFSLMISFSWPLQSALSAFVQHGILFHFGVSSLCTRARSQVRGRVVCVGPGIFKTRVPCVCTNDLRVAWPCVCTNDLRVAWLLRMDSTVQKQCSKNAFESIDLALKPNKVSIIHASTHEHRRTIHVQTSIARR